MKADIHPKYFPDAKVTCACGAKYTVGSTKESYRIDICSACHPFYTGKQKLVDTAGRVDKFLARQKIAATKKAEIAAREKKRVVKKAETMEEKIIRKIREQEKADEQPIVQTIPAPAEEQLKAQITKKPVIVKKSALKPIVKKIAVKPAAKKPVIKKLVAKKLIIKKQAPKKSVVKKAATAKTVNKKKK